MLRKYWEYILNNISIMKVRLCQEPTSCLRGFHEDRHDFHGKCATWWVIVVVCDALSIGPNGPMGNDATCRQVWHKGWGSTQTLHGILWEKLMMPCLFHEVHLLQYARKCDLREDKHGRFSRVDVSKLRKTSGPLCSHLVFMVLLNRPWSLLPVYGETQLVFCGRSGWILPLVASHTLGTWPIILPKNNAKIVRSDCVHGSLNVSFNQDGNAGKMYPCGWKRDKRERVPVVADPALITTGGTSRCSPQEWSRD